jgi:hypothetical protein
MLNITHRAEGEIEVSSNQQIEAIEVVSTLGEVFAPQSQVFALPTGLYFIRVKVNGGWVMKHVVVVR